MRYLTLLIWLLLVSPVSAQVLYLSPYTGDGSEESPFKAHGVGQEFRDAIREVHIRLDESAMGFSHRMCRPAAAAARMASLVARLVPSGSYERAEAESVARNAPSLE